MSTNLRETLVGLLLDHPNHAYALKRILAPRVAPADSVNDGVLYPLLRKLEKENIISGRQDVSKSNRTRTIYTVTSEGRVWFQNWLETNLQEDTTPIYDFFLGNPLLVKVQFFNQLLPEQQIEKYAAHLRRTKDKLKLLSEIRVGMVERKADSFRIALLDLGISQQKCTKRWLAEQVKSLKLRENS
ncbi:MAG: helix-turn-helix transcriptional regulator [Pseudomonas marincola]